ncbi:MAG: hypothetical protein IH989_02955 [Planctomycetes bacterium]|nr:hypothetical protein [Planctomycetota bacterium]
MPRRGSAILFSIWALVLLPVLCMGGFIGHVCDCTSGTNCRHEEGCDDDPCGQLSAATRQRAQASTAVFVTFVAEIDRAGSSCSCGPSNCFSQRYSLILQEARRPFAPSDIPLLV